MTTNLLITKFYQPHLSPKQIRRNHLVQKLWQGVESGHRMTLVSAPAGYGKSMAVAEWLGKLSEKGEKPWHTGKVTASWLSLEPSDNDMGRFFTYVLAALNQKEDLFCKDLFASLRAGEIPGVDVLVSDLVNAMSAWNILHILVLDDFHTIQEKTILDALMSILTHAPPNFHLVLVTREDPPMPLSRMRLRGQLTEIRAADLRFSVAEANLLFRDGLGLEIPAVDVTRLTERTEGWAAGLQLAGVSLRGRENPGEFVQALSGSHRLILDYLTEEALKTRPPEVQEFLLKTSILPRLSRDLCQAVTGCADSAGMLERLLAANLFIIPLDDVGRWYRYHHLFAELLQHRLKHEFAADLSDLHQRASRWHEAQGMPVASIEHALAAGDEVRVVTLLEKYAWHLLTHGHSRPLMKWVESLPEVRRKECPKLTTVIVWGKILHGEYREGALYLAAAHAALEKIPPETIEAGSLQADILALQSFLTLAQGHATEALSLAEKARMLTPEDNTRLIGSTALALGVAYRMEGRFDEAIASLEEALQSAQTIDDHVTALVAVEHLALIWFQLGQLRRLIHEAEFAIKRTEIISQVAPMMIGTVHAVIGQVYYEWNQIETAREMLLHGLRVAQLSGQPTSVIYVCIYLARLCQETGDLEAAARYLDEASNALAQGGPSWARLDLVAQQVNLLVSQGNPAEAETRLRATGIPADAFYPVRFDSDGEVLAAVFVDQRKVGRKIYTKLESHDMKGSSYTITNKAFVSDNSNQLGRPAELSVIDEWAELEPVASIQGADKLLFAYFKAPGGDPSDLGSPLGVSCYARAVELIRDADKLHSGFLWEFESGERALYADVVAFKKDDFGNLILPKKRLYRALASTHNIGEGELFKEWTPTLREQNFLNALNAQYRKIELATGMAYGTLSDPESVARTATEITMARQRTYSTVRDIQRNLKAALERLIEAIDFYGTAYALAPKGAYQTAFEFDDSVLVDKEAQMQTDRQAVSMGLMPKTVFLMRNYGLDEATAKDWLAMQREESPQELFSA